LLVKEGGRPRLPLQIFRSSILSDLLSFFIYSPPSEIELLIYFIAVGIENMVLINVYICSSVVEQFQKKYVFVRLVSINFLD